MHPKDLVFAGLVQLATLATAAGIIIGFRVAEPGLALIVSAVAGTQTAAWLYQRRKKSPAPLSAMATTGALLAVLCLLATTLIQVVSRWMTYPEIVIPIGAVGSFASPFVLFGTVQRALAGGKRNVGLVRKAPKTTT
jgi:hypothetical protein